MGCARQGFTTNCSLLLLQGMQLCANLPAEIEPTKTPAQSALVWAKVVKTHLGFLPFVSLL